MKECTFKPQILRTKVAQELGEQIEPSREMRLQKHLERKEVNFKAHLQEKTDRDSKELSFKPQISKY